MIKVQINYIGKADFLRVKKQRTDILKLVCQLVKAEKNHSQIVSVTFTDDFEIRKLNRKYRKLNRATDVLAFPLGEDNVLGDVVISADTARRNAKRFKQTLESEIKRLVVHGVLHLLGYNHKEMKRYAQKIN